MKAIQDIKNTVLQTLKDCVQDTYKRPNIHKNPHTGYRFQLDFETMSFTYTDVYVCDSGTFCCNSGGNGLIPDNEEFCQILTTLAQHKNSISHILILEDETLY